jgi:hypothetical protein
MTDEMTTADIANRRQAETDAAPQANVATEDVTANGGRSALLDRAQADSFHGRWTELQSRFVDSPQDAVREADGLVAELMQRLAETFSRERENLESQWTRGEDVSTEDLRVALTRYRSFFDRLLST